MVSLPVSSSNQKTRDLERGLFFLSGGSAPAILSDTAGRWATIEENGHHLALYLPFAIPFTFRNIDGIKLRVRRLQSDAIVFLLLIEALERGAAACSLLQVNRDDD